MSSALHVGFTGTRFPLAERQKEVLADALIGLRQIGITWLHTGDCIGADTFAGQYWQAMGGMVHLHPPTDPGFRAFLTAEVSDGMKPYLVRNADIVNVTDAMIATPEEATEQRRGGTWSTIRLARKKKKPLMIIFPNGAFSKENWPDHIERERKELAQ